MPATIELPTPMIRLFLTLSIVALAIAGIAGFLALQDTPNIDTLLKEHAPGNGQNTVILDRHNHPIYSYGKFQHKHMALANVNEQFIQALIATEDRRFYAHPGIDPLGIARAMLVNLRQKSVSQGASTLTQQLVRTLYLSNARSYKRKLQEVWLSLQLEQRLSKDDILEAYLNNVYFGEGAYGIAAASQIYFNVPPANLTLPQAATLAGLPQAPSQYNPFYNKDDATARRNEVLQNMVEAGYLTSEKAKAAQDTPLTLNPHGRLVSDAHGAPYFTQYVIQQIRDYFGLDEQTFWQSGLQIHTTLDPAAQQHAHTAILNNPQLANTPALQVAALMLDLPSGDILAYIGGRNYAKSQYDRVKLANRPPGSLFKVFTYAAAMERGLPFNQVYLDVPIQVKDWAPKNYSGEHVGPTTLARAFITSNNIVAVKLLHAIDPSNVVALAKRLGVRSTLEPNLSLTLGSSSTTLWEMCAAIGAIGANGQRVEPHAITRVTDRQGRELFKHYAMPQTVLEPSTTEPMQALMAGVVKLGTGRAANIGRPAAGKTGTSDDNRDGWFVGYTPNTLMGVWMGRDDNEPVSHLVGGGAPAQIWGHTLRGYPRGAARRFNWQHVSPLTLAFINTVDFSLLADTEQDNPLHQTPIAMDEYLEDPELEVDESLLDDGMAQDMENATGEPLIGPPTPNQGTTTGLDTNQQALPTTPVHPAPYSPQSTQAVRPPRPAPPPVRREFQLSAPQASDPTTPTESVANVAVDVYNGPPTPNDPLIPPVPPTP